MKKYFVRYSIFFSIVVVSIAASTYLLYSESIRLDESQSIWAATKSIPAILDYTAQDVHVPLYSVLLHFWIQFFGTNIIFARTLSFLFFIFSLPVLYLLAKESSNRSTAMLTVVIFSLSPFVMWYTNEARMYTLFVLVTLLSNLFFLRFFRSRGESSRTLYFFSTLIGLYTHYFFFFLLISQVIFVILWLGVQYFRDRKNVSFFRFLQLNRSFPIQFAILLATVFAFFVPWIVYVVFQGSASNTQPLIPPPTTYNLFQTFVHFFFGFQQQGIQAIIISLWPLSVVILFLIFTQKKALHIRNLSYFIIITFLPIFFVFLGSYIRPIFLSRYLILVIPTLFFLVSSFLLNYSRRVSSLLVYFIVIAMFVLLIYQNTSNATPVRENYEGVASYLTEHATPRDVIAVSSPFTIYPIEYSYEGAARITTIPEWNRYSEGAIPPYSDSLLEHQITGYVDRYQNLYTVLSYDQGYEDDIRTYLDSNFELLTQEHFSPGLELRVYKISYDQ